MLSRIKRLFFSFFDTWVFVAIRPWNWGVSVCGLSHISLPWMIKIGRGSFLSAPAPKDTIQIGKVWIGRDVEINATGEGRIRIGSGTTIQDRCKIQGQVTIENDAILAPNVFISSGNHEAFAFPYLNIREQDRRVAGRHRPVHIEEDVWLGANVFVRAGISIGRGAIIGTNSVVVGDVPAYSVYGGIPARPLKTRLSLVPMIALDPKNEAHRPYFYRGFVRPEMKMSRESLLLMSSRQKSLRLKIVSSETFELHVTSSLYGSATTVISPGSADYTLNFSLGESKVSFPKTPSSEFQFFSLQSGTPVNVQVLAVEMIP